MVSIVISTFIAIIIIISITSIIIYINTINIIIGIIIMVIIRKCSQMAEADAEACQNPIFDSPHDKQTSKGKLKGQYQD